MLGLKYSHLKLLCFVVIIALVFILQLTNAQVRKSMSLEDKVQQLSEMSAKRSVMKFNVQKFKEFIKNSPRNYSTIVMFTALASHRGCQICHSASDEYTIVANSFRYSKAFTNSLFFVSVDYDEGPEVFNMLNLNTAPIFMHFPSKGKPKNADLFDIQRAGFSADAIARWITENTDVQIRIIRPPNYGTPVACALLACMIGSFLYIRKDSLGFIYNKQLWGISAIFFCFAMVSGQMWNHIRSPPFTHNTQNGIAYIHGSSQGQFVSETYIIMVLNAAIVGGMILISEAAKSKVNVRVRRILVILGLALITIFFSAILSIFRSKAHGYPYSFIF